MCMLVLTLSASMVRYFFLMKHEPNLRMIADTGGNWILGGQLLENQTIVDYGLRLVDACFNTYQSTE